MGGYPSFQLYHDLAYTSTRSPKLDWDIQFGIVEERVPAAFRFAVDSFSVFIQTTNRSFVYQELVVRAIFIIAAGVVATVFYYKLAFARMNYPWRSWALEQKWTFILLALLIGFNNPLMFLFLNSDESKDFGIFVDVSLRYTFLMGYFMALLCMTDHMAQVCYTPRHATPHHTTPHHTTPHHTTPHHTTPHHTTPHHTTPHHTTPHHTTPHHTTPHHTTPQQTKKKSTRDFYLPKFLLLAPCWVRTSAVLLPPLNLDKKKRPPPSHPHPHPPHHRPFSSSTPSCRVPTTSCRTSQSWRTFRSCSASTSYGSSSSSS